MGVSSATAGNTWSSSWYQRGSDLRAAAAFRWDARSSWAARDAASCELFPPEGDDADLAVVFFLRMGFLAFVPAPVALVTVLEVLLVLVDFLAAMLVLVVVVVVSVVVSVSASTSMVVVGWPIIHETPTTVHSPTGIAKIDVVVILVPSGCTASPRSPAVVDHVSVAGIIVVLVVGMAVAVAIVVLVVVNTRTKIVVVIRIVVGNVSTATAPSGFVTKGSGTNGWRRDVVPGRNGREAGGRGNIRRGRGRRRR
mmetsp:Transcript_993/g.1897  ORF Transcript_993/g.1897 Transcript_993/m.1897 type:complete len:253 (-) Transcript_993:1424-2182(-)